MTRPSPRSSMDSVSTASTTSLVFERLGEANEKLLRGDQRDRYLDDEDPLKAEANENDPESAHFLSPGARLQQQGMDRSLRRCLIVLGLFLCGAWAVGLFSFITSGAYKHASQFEHDPNGASRGSGKTITLDQVVHGQWRASEHEIGWIPGPDGEDGLLLEANAPNKDYLVVEDIRAQEDSEPANQARAGGIAGLTQRRTLMKQSTFQYGGRHMLPAKTWPSPNLRKVLIATDVKKTWRHSFTAVYWILNVESQSVEPLDPFDASARIQLAVWSPQSDVIAFTRGNNMFLRHLDANPNKKITQITRDGGKDFFYDIPDWVYEEEVFQSYTALWWSKDGKFIAFMRTNESLVPEYPVQYFVSRPSQTQPPPGLDTYPEERRIKYPRPGAPNPVVDILFYSVERGDDPFTVEIAGGFDDDDRLITMVLWAGDKVIIKETNRDSVVLRVVLVDVAARTGKTVNTIDVGKVDGGWFEISQDTTFIPADPNNGRPLDGYIDRIIYNNNDHLAYFTPLDNPEPIMLTSGEWEVDETPSAVDLQNNRVYFVAAKESPIQRHVYSVKLDGSEMTPLTNVSEDGYYSASFSSGTGFALLNYQGPKIPWQKVISTPTNPHHYARTIEKNEDLSNRASIYELPLLEYGTITVDNFTLNYVERRPPHFDKNKKYPVLFSQYSGPGSQQVKKRFEVSFESYVASTLGYIVVTVDGRGTGFMGRATRVPVRGNLGYWESHDQIAAGKIWAARKYVDASRLAIWGWSFGGYNTLKTLEADAGETFQYGMAVAPVTDWRFYDSIYTERYMGTVQANPRGYEQSAVRNVTALSKAVRFLIMHGTGDDNVHVQNSYTLLDRLVAAQVENYDVHVFPDSDHSISHNGARQVVYDKLSNWLVNAFNGEWVRVADPKPKGDRRV